MTDEAIRPLAILIFANTGENLTHLKEEVRSIEQHLSSGDSCDVLHIEAATFDAVFTTLSDEETAKRTVIVHFAGHSEGKGIQLVSEQGDKKGQLAHIQGFAGILKTLPNLRLFFINGCSSREQVLELSQAGIPLSIATNQGINDALASRFADRFYQCIGSDRSIHDAFELATSACATNARTDAQTDTKKTRALKTQKVIREIDEAQSTGSSAWGIYGPRSDRGWKLSLPFHRGSGPTWDYTQYELNTTSPYLGLRSFVESEGDRFFGRDELVGRMLEALEHETLQVVIGASGSGKSSVVKAGMIPGWKQAHDIPSSSDSNYRVIEMTPESDPTAEFSVALSMPDPEGRKFDRSAISKTIKEHPEQLFRRAHEALGNGKPWLILIDQFEQLLTRTTESKKRETFIASIVDLVQSQGQGTAPKVQVVLAMRDDFFHQLRAFREFYSLTASHIYPVGALDRAALREVIERPAAEHGVTFESDLVDEIVALIDGQPGALPLLQYTLDALWKLDDVTDLVLNRSSYSQLGGVLGSLGNRFEVLYESLGETDRNDFRWMMLKLVTYDRQSGLGKPVSRAARRDEFQGRQSDFVEQLVEKEKLLVSTGNRIQLAHEQIITAWPAFQEWGREHREAIGVREELIEAAENWENLRLERPRGETMLGVHEQTTLEQKVQVKKRKVIQRSLWQGSKLERALELNNAKGFDQIGGLTGAAERFLKSSYHQSRRRFYWVLSFAAVALLAAMTAGCFGWYLREANHRLVQESAKTLLAPIGASEKRTDVEKAHLEAISKADVEIRLAVLDNALRKREDHPFRADRVPSLAGSVIGKEDNDLRNQVIDRYVPESLNDPDYDASLVLVLASHLEVGSQRETAEDGQRDFVIDALLDEFENGIGKDSEPAGGRLSAIDQLLLRIAKVNDASTNYCLDQISSRKKGNQSDHWVGLHRQLLQQQSIDALVAGWARSDTDTDDLFFDALRGYQIKDEDRQGSHIDRWPNIKLGLSNDKRIAPALIWRLASLENDDATGKIKAEVIETCKNYATRFSALTGILRQQDDRVSINRQTELWNSVHPIYRILSDSNEQSDAAAFRERCVLELVATPMGKVSSVVGPAMLAAMIDVDLSDDQFMQIVAWIAQRRSPHRLLSSLAELVTPERLSAVFASSRAQEAVREFDAIIDKVTKTRGRQMPPIVGTIRTQIRLATPVTPVATSTIASSDENPDTSGNDSPNESSAPIESQGRPANAEKE